MTQGVEVRGDRVYFYGDGSTGVIKEYSYKNNELKHTGLVMRLIQQEFDLIPHPTGLTYHDTIGTFIGSSRGREGVLYYVDWNMLKNTRNLNWAVLNATVDDLATHGTRPEFVQVYGNWYIATADYGNQGNEIRLYDPFLLQTARNTSEPGVLVHKFKTGPFIQNLHWNNSTGELILVQNTSSGKGWRLQKINLQASIEFGHAAVINTTEFPDKLDALEGFHRLDSDSAIAVTNSNTGNATVLKKLAP